MSKWRNAVLGGVLLLGMAIPGADGGQEDGEGDHLSRATFAGGCFWCMQPPFDRVEGVVETVVGYTGGRVEDPTYEQVSAGTTGHAEAIRVIYDPRRVGYAELLDVFWRNVDPFDAGGQFCDRGNQYRSAVFFHDEEQERLAEESRKAIEERFGREVATQVAQAGPFYRAEEYHQNYYRERPIRYRLYTSGCGRGQRLAEIWGPPEHDDSRE
jgi:peptide-methionine (S)-S-oxide reductase